ncbi:MAG TPA: dihydroorotate dehydrogenase, partial [Bacillota bacterium]|nr:dihydroorotate dehydrogenase [Bacillota bacterium]
MADLTVSLGRLKLKNPITVASGTFGFGREYASYYSLSELGAVITSAVTLEKRVGNKPPRLAETPAGILNSIGLENPGVEHFLQEDLPYLQRSGATVIVNIAGRTVEEYRAVAERLSQAEGIAALEVNISCPNVKEGGITFGTEPQMAQRVTASVREVWPGPLIVKLSPNVTDIALLARAVVEAGAEILSLINTITGMAIDPETWQPKLGNIVGGLSGPAIKPVAVRMVWQVAQAVDVPIIGMGGIVAVEDVVEFLLAGATAVSVGTGNFRQPTLARDLVGELDEYL